jgi:hypothetical protein
MRAKDKYLPVVLMCLCFQLALVKAGDWWKRILLLRGVSYVMVHKSTIIFPIATILGWILLVPDCAWAAM